MSEGDRGRKSKSTYIVEEIVKTEESYLEGLHRLIELYHEPMLFQNMLPPEALAIVFGNLEEIIDINSFFLLDIQSTGVESAFEHIVPFFNAYAIYAENFDKALATIHYFSHKWAEFAKFKERQHALPESKGLGLEAHLILPVQRIPRYRLLVESLRKATDEGSESQLRLLVIEHRIGAVCSHINTFMKNQDSITQMISLQERIKEVSFIAPGRCLLKEGPLMKMSYDCSSKRRMCFLFNDLFLFAREDPRDSSLSCRGSMNLRQCTVQFAVPPATHKYIPRMIMLREGGVTVLFFGKNLEETTEWLQAIERAIWKSQQLPDDVDEIPKMPEETEMFVFGIVQMGSFACTVDQSCHIIIDSSSPFAANIAGHSSKSCVIM